ncbi:hypothetical protein [Pseudoxanthomonas sp.]|uniref:hypothetical protein n=1 Tax=Pseudoxanthomonas sp. TaxID=1871049 RepID=UPI002609E7FB|nr:hypothetical protein [Pseudoxanthomonas sp.]WDS36204.1 MAG: hypothetical protein O8I58_18365 [Pseudoxanthomonas sp.]
MAHTYHRQCGCYSCGKAEEASERDEEMAGPYIEALKGCPTVLSEAMGELTEEEMASMAASLATGDNDKFALTMRTRIGMFVYEAVECRMDDLKCDMFTAATRLADAYGAEPLRQAVAA